MFGFFNKTKQIRILTEFLFLQNGILKDMVNILKSRNCRLEHTDIEILPDSICGEWEVKDLSICLFIRKENNGYYASICDLNNQTKDYGESYPIREYKDICYFILDSYAIFVEYDKDKNRIELCGNLSMVCRATNMTSYPAVPLEFNPN